MSCVLCSSSSCICYYINCKVTQTHLFTHHSCIRGKRYIIILYCSHTPLSFLSPYIRISYASTLQHIVTLHYALFCGYPILSYTHLILFKTIINSSGMWLWIDLLAPVRYFQEFHFTELLFDSFVSLPFLFFPQPPSCIFVTVS